MAFLDNSGDIILDAVLTDTGRFRMARGDFRISKFALGDDEIDYSLFNKSHPSGSAYYDLEVLRTPLLEAFTNNTSTMKSKLLTITQTNILYLPVLKLLDGGNSGGKQTPGFAPLGNTATATATSGYIITCDKPTERTGTPTTDGLRVALASNDGKGVLFGSDQSRLANDTNNFIAIERGLDTDEIAPSVAMPATLQETQFIIEADYRLAAVTDLSANPVPVSFIDDDQIASYYVTAGSTEGNVVRDSLDSLRTDLANSDDELSAHHIRGPRDRVIQFKMQPSINLIASDFLFDKLGTTVTLSGDPVFYDGNYKIIDSLVRVTSATTAYSIDVPVRYIKRVPA